MWYRNINWARGGPTHGQPVHAELRRLLPRPEDVLVRALPLVHLAGRTGTLAHRPDAGLTHCTGGGISGYDHAVCTVHVLTAT